MLGRDLYQIQLSLPLWIERQKEKLGVFFAFLFSKGPDYWVGTDFSMWEKVIQAVNSGVALNEDSTEVNISG